MKDLNLMRKALMLALCFGVASANTGLERITNSNERVSAIATDNRAINSSSSGIIPVSKEVCKDFITEPALLGKIAYAFGLSPYVCNTNSYGEITFSDKRGSFSTVKYSRDYISESTIRKEVEISGERPFSDFKAYMNIICTAKDSETKYNSNMSIVLENRFARWAVKGLRVLPYTREKVEKFFKAEQDSVGKMMANLAKEMHKNPNEFINTVRNGTNGIFFTEEEIERTEKYMRKHGFLK